MDPITHGIAGALIGKAFFDKRENRVSIFAATLGAVFPDVDIFAEPFARAPLSMIRLHRGFTHSFAGIPIFAFALAALTKWFCRRRGWASPSMAMLTFIYALGIASHILLDATTSFGTRLWNPFLPTRVEWDTLFIIDFSFTAIILVPQVAAWVFRDREKAAGRAVAMWLLFDVCGVGVWSLSAYFGYPFRFAILWIVSAVLALVFLLPLARGSGFGISRARWCQFGFALMLVYLAAATWAHHAALARVKDFAAGHHLEGARLGAIPIPPSLLDWSGKIRTGDGVFQARFDLRDSAPPSFQFMSDSPHDAYISKAMTLPDVGVYLWFARFPVIHSYAIGDTHVVEFGDSRFNDVAQHMRTPFPFRVIFDSSGNFIAEDWADGASGFRVRRKMRDLSTPEQR
jgi:membrane-bound metal-dependent hydrolase YbcI (DUF457 family)